MKEDTILSKQKISFNLKKYGWIIVAICAVVAVVVLLTNKSGTEAEKEQQIYGGGQLYQSDSMIYIEQEVDDTMLMYSAYTLVASNYASLINSSSVLDELNKRLVKNGYLKLHEGDILDAEADTSNIVIISVISPDVPERTKFIADQLAELILELGDEKFAVKDSYILDKAGVYAVTEWKTGSYMKTYSQPEEAEAGFSLSKKSLLLICFGILLGCGIIFMIIVFDNKIYKREDLAQNVDMMYLGSYDSDKESNTEMAMTVARRCELLDAKKMAVVTLAADPDSVKEHLADAFADAEFSVHAGRKLNEIVLKDIEACDGIVLYLVCGKDSIKEFNELKRKLDLIDGKIFGYILDEEKIR